MNDPNKDEDTVDPNKRRPQRLLDSLVQRDDELSDSEDEGEGGRKNHATHRDPDSSILSPTGTRRFGVGVGIMGAAPLGVGSAAVAGGLPSVIGSGGPSARHSAPVIDVDAMEIDDDAGGPTEVGKGSIPRGSAGSEIAAEQSNDIVSEHVAADILDEPNGAVQPVPQVDPPPEPQILGVESKADEPAPIPPSY